MTSISDSSHRLPLTAIILAHEDGSLLKQAQQSVQFAQEVLTIYHPDEINNFSHVRNQALEQASHEWVLFLDSDELIMPESIPLIADIIKTDQYAGVYLHRTDYFHGQPLRHGEVGQIQLMRLMKKSTAHYSGSVHETATIMGPTTVSRIHLLHFAHPDISQFAAVNARYAQLAAERVNSAAGEQFQLWKLIVLPLGKFVWNFIFLSGFLDGWRGFIYAYMMSLHSLWVRSYQYQYDHQPLNTDSSPPTTSLEVGKLS